MISHKNILDLELRKKIYQHILKYPGLHLVKLSGELDIPKTTLRHHLKFLKSHELISTKSEGKYLRYYAKEQFGKRDKEILTLFRQEVPSNMILYMMVYVVASRSELSRHLEKHPTTIAFHLKKFKELDIVETAEIGNGVTVTGFKTIKIAERTPLPNETLYRLKDIQHIYDLLIVYNKNIFEKSILNCIFEIKEYRRYMGKPKKFIDPDKEVDFLLEFFFDIFPNPYHV